MKAILSSVTCSDAILIWVCKSEKSLSATLEFIELISSPILTFTGVITQVWDSSSWVFSFFNVSFVAFIDVIMERIFKSNSVVLLSTLDSNCESSNDRFIWSPRIRNETSSVEQSGPNDISFEVLFNSALFEMPSNNFDVRVSIISDLEEVKAIIVPVVALGNKAIIEVVVYIVVMTKVIGWINPSSWHQ